MRYTLVALAIICVTTAAIAAPDSKPAAKPAAAPTPEPAPERPPAAPVVPADVPYDAGLYRLSELLGSLHFLRNLCGEKGDAWRQQMEQLVASEKPDAERRKRLIGSFNRGYRSFAANYTRCTPSAIDAINRYTAEGEKLSGDLAARYGN